MENKTGLIKGRNAINKVLEYVEKALKEKKVEYMSKYLVRAKLLLIVMKDEQIDGDILQNGKPKRKN